MKLVLSLVILCLAGASAKSVQDLQSELLQAIREMIEDPPQGEDNTIDPMPPYPEKEEAPQGEDNILDPMPPNTEEEGAPPSEDNTIGPMTPITEEEEEDSPPGEDITIGSMPPPSSEEEEEETPSEDMGQDPLPAYPDGEESDAAEDMGPFLTDGEEEEEGDPPDKKTVQDLESELLHAIRQMIEDPEILQAGREVKSNKVQDVTMKVTYKGEESEEKVSFDDVTGSETILVSARSDMEEANIRHCFNEVSREDLPACLADFQPDFAVFSAVKAPADEGTVTDDRGDAGLAQEGKRYVSGGGGSQQCARGACPIRKQVQKQQHRAVCRLSFVSCLSNVSGLPSESGDVRCDLLRSLLLARSFPAIT
uniref:Uncharacterized protein n=1 Tax=Branchiostoma floridae TaxID=7739 RepID=C3ZVB2_BRAFL|eukprot:XP_002587491.1 hypothetical protein BRAFLDRAFT_99382 [Branchiostoma floridae]